MKVRVELSKFEDAIIHNREIKRIVFEVLKNAFEMPYEDMYIKEGKLVYDNEVCTSHCWTETEVVRHEATEKDKLYCEVRNVVYKYLQRAQNAGGL